jgi:biopolymer transport protein ExbD
MGMSVSSSSSVEPMCDVNTTPLIDVMLVLLVMLIVTLPVQNHAVDLDMPIPAPPPLNPPPPSPRIVIEIDSDGAIVWNGGVVGGGIPELDGLFSRETSQNPQPEIHLRPARRAKYDVVANVMASAQRHNMTKLGFANVSEFAD